MSTKSKVSATRPRLEARPAPERACTVQQIEELHPGVRGRMRQYIFRSSKGDPAYAWLKPAILRPNNRSVLIDEVLFVAGLRQRSGLPPAPARRHGPVVRGEEGDA